VALIGFRRNVYLEWLEEAAALFCMGVDTREVRDRLDGVLKPTVRSDVNRRQAIDILVNIWGPPEGGDRRLREHALALYQATTERDEHVALHYGMTLVAYPFFRQGAVLIGRRLRFGGSVRTADVREGLMAKLGNLGAVKDASKRIVFSLRDWGLLVDAGKRHHYTVREPRVALGHEGLECWLLAAALSAHPAEELPLQDLKALPELFPFRVQTDEAQLGASGLLELLRLGGGWDAVRLRDGGA